MIRVLLIPHSPHMVPVVALAHQALNAVTTHGVDGDLSLQLSAKAAEAQKLQHCTAQATL